MNTYYLVDYENVHCEGLAGCAKLDGSARVIIFFTDNARKIDMAAIADHGSANLEMLEIPSGKQSADMHIGSYLGFLAASSLADDIRVVVVSGDTDFDRVISFWRTRQNLDARRAKSIASAVKQPSKKAAAESKAAAKPKAAAPPKATAKQKAPCSPLRKTEINAEVFRTLAKAKYAQDAIGSVASIVAKCLEGERAKQVAYHAIVSKFGQKDGLEIYRLIRGLL